MSGYVLDGYVLPGYIGRPGSPVSFSLNGNTCTFSRNPVRPDRSLGFIQADIKSGGYERIGRDYYTTNDLIDLYWPRMPGWDKNRLFSWWQNVARGMANPFNYFDIDGNTATVRFAVPQLPEIRERAYDAYEVRTQLRVV
jgi:hypothetical protein